MRNNKNSRNLFTDTAFKIVLILICLSTIGFSQENNSDKKDDFSVASAGYQLKQGDKISIKFLYQPELNETSLVIPPDGRINLQLIDEFSVIGLTVSKIKKDLERAYEEILIKPVITVTLIDFVAPHIFIGGEISKPGRYSLRDGKTLVQMVLLAGGLTRSGNKKIIIHARPDGNGDWKLQSINFSNILSQKGNQKDISLEDGDYIFVPESKISQFSKAVEGFRGFLPRVF